VADGGQDHPQFYQEGWFHDYNIFESVYNSDQDNVVHEPFLSAVRFA